MSGFGRRTQYRKHLTDAVLNDLPEPGEGERIAQVVGTRGGNLFEVIVALRTDDDDGSGKKIDSERESSSTKDTKTKTPQLAILPTKFHKLVWVKRNNFVIVSCGDDGEEQDEKDQVNHLKSRKLWPPEFESEEDKKETATSSASRTTNRWVAEQQDNVAWTSGEDDEDEEYEEGVYEEDGIVFNENYDDDYFVNTNRVDAMKIEESSESEDSDDDDE